MDLTKAIGQFGDDFFKSLIRLSPHTGNVLISPLGVSTALSMLMVGARNKSQVQLRNVFHPNATGSRRDGDLASTGNKAGKSEDVLILSNMALFSQVFSIEPEYVDTLRSEYKAEVRKVWFGRSGHEIKNQVNKWVATSTNGLIASLLSQIPSPHTPFMLVNCLYFRSDWQNEFSPRSNVKHFTLTSGQVKKTSFITCTEYFKFLEVDYGSKGDFMQMIRIPYKGQSSMMVLLPPKPKSANQLINEQSLDHLLMTFLRDGVRRHMELHLPEFSLKFQLSINDILKKMGAADIFDQHSADLTGISKSSKLYVSDIEHATAMEVGEKGAKGTGATVASKFLR